jgi:hypothetical protein
MSADRGTREDVTAAGLCANCVHSKKIISDRGAVFWQCGLASTDPRFPKYPRLPVLQCSGYRKI